MKFVSFPLDTIIISWYNKGVERKWGKMKYYEVTCVRGHCGSGKSTNYITFYYKGANSVEAIMWAKRQPGVKHSRMPLGCFEISEAKYKEKIKVSAYKRAFAR